MTWTERNQRWQYVTQQVTGGLTLVAIIALAVWIWNALP